MIIILGLLVAILAGFRVWKLPSRKRWLAAVATPIIVGSVALLHSLYWFHRTNCGSLYSPDIGCANAGGSWDVIVGFGAAAMFTIVCIVALVYTGRQPQLKHPVRHKSV